MMVMMTDDDDDDDDDNACTHFWWIEDDDWDVNEMVQWMPWLLILKIGLNLKSIRLKCDWMKKKNVESDHGSNDHFQWML